MGQQVNNLEERVKIDTVKEALTRVFKHYGPILDVIAKSSLKRKGQAFIVFDSEQSALEAVEEMNGFEMYGKVMQVRRARTHSDETVKRKAPDMFDEHKRKRLMLKGTDALLNMLLPRFPRPMLTILFAQTASAPKKTQKRRPTPSQPRSLGHQNRAQPWSPTNTCDPTRRSFCKTFPATSTRTISRRYSSASKASRKCAWFRSGPWPLPSLRMSSLPLQRRRRRQTRQLVPKASQ